ncbi:alpha-2-macroglobulin family protein [Desertivirga arenae]|uniref:alpha-2-macroglobulin family protein n=1 Tax=Desertivirga arenae TaxID=2810309 RepID=UPI001A95EC48|nr:alpha-2-macroglobulin family protein [Pedobacter sp. SYSU D00823]
MLKFSFHKALLLSFLALLFTNSVAQEAAYRTLIFQADSLIIVGRPQLALKKINAIDQLKDKKGFWLVEAAVYRIKLIEEIEDEEINPIVNQLKKDIEKADFPENRILQSLLAETYWKYYQRNRYDINSRSTLDEPGPDISKWGIQALINETSKFYKQSISNRDRLQEIPIGKYNEILEGDTLTRRLRPTLYDLLAHRSLEFFLNEEPAVTRPKLPFTLNDPELFSDNGALASYQIITADTASTYYEGFKVLQQLTQFHLKDKDPEALIDVDLKRLAFLFQESVLPEKDTLYVRALQKIVDVQKGNLKAEALCLLAEYYKNSRDLIRSRFYAQKATDLDGKLFAISNAKGMIREIENRQMIVEIEKYNIPNQRILASISYRNVKKVFVKVIKLSPLEKKQLNTIEQNIRGKYKPNAKDYQLLLDFFNKKTTGEQFAVDLPDFKDFKDHRTEFQMLPRQIGDHAALVIDANSDELSLTHLVHFTVTRLSFVARQKPDKTKEVLVLDRYSGKPVSGAMVKVTRRDWRKNKPELIGIWKTNDLGKVSFGDYGNLTVKIKKGVDSIEVSDVGISGNTLNRKDADPTPVPNVTFFSDRSIYRPGQKLYFKGLMTSTVNKRSFISKGTNVEVEFWSWGNRSRVGVKDFKTNDFGTFSGSFEIPEDAINGEYWLRTTWGVLSVQVEEYKRPTFSIAVQPIKESYRFNDSVKVRGTVKALAGYGLANTKVAYSIVRTRALGGYPFFSEIENDMVAENNEIKIASDTVITNTSGDFVIPFKALINRQEQSPDMVYNYNIAISSISSTGETHTAKSSVTVGEKLLSISAIMPEEDVLQDTVSIPVSLSNLNGTPQSGKIKAFLYELVSPDTAYRRRLWAHPDTMIIPKIDFLSNFPSYSYIEPKLSNGTLGKMVSDTVIIIRSGLQGIINLRNLSRFKMSGYCLKLFAENEKGDTSSAVYYPNASRVEFGNPNRSGKWIVSLGEKPSKDNRISFAVRVKGSYMLLAEVYKGAEIIYSQWLNPDARNGEVSLPINGTSDFNVQFLAVVDNTVLTWQKEFHMQAQRQNLNVKLLTYRNKVEPGAKENWRLSVSKQRGGISDSEVLVSMYDSSLDGLKKTGGWTQPFLQPVYNSFYYQWNTSDFQSLFSSNALDEDEYFAEMDKSIYEKINDHPSSYRNFYYTYDEPFEDLEHKANKTKNNRTVVDAAYRRNLLLFKNGFDVVGKVIHTALAYPWINIRIDGSSFVTSVDKNGYFKLRVPVGRDLIVSCKYFKDKRIRPLKGFPLLIQFGNGMSIKDPGVKTLEGDPNAEVRIDQPVGATPPSLQALVVEDNAVYEVANIELKAPPLPLLPPPDKLEIQVRKNFNETAFFYPHLLADAKGEVSFDFTMPESLTSWKFRAFAHNKEMESGYGEIEVLTQKKLMVSANMPRFFREGDFITVQARVVNLGSEKIKGRAELEIYDPAKKEHINLLESSEVNKSFSIFGNGATALSYKFKVPEKINTLTYKISAVTGTHTDAEENIIPVLPDKLQITESMPMIVRSGEDKTFVLERLFNSKSSSRESINLAFEFTQNTSWSAIQALPYLIEYPYECSEQIFNRYFANRFASDIVSKYKIIQQVFNQWKAASSSALLSDLEKNKELKSVLIEETPWLKDVQDEEEQKRRIALLFDLNKVSAGLAENAEKLKRAQMSNGAFSWFSGSRYGDPYISKYLLTGFGELKFLVKQGDEELKGVKEGLLKYVESELLNDYRNRGKEGYQADIEGWFARSYFPEKLLGNDLSKAKDYFLNSVQTRWVEEGLSGKAKIALIARRYGDTELSDRIVKSLEESATRSAELGMFWQGNKAGMSVIQSPIETQALLIKVFSECTNNKAAVEEMKVWLLCNKRVAAWESTKATAAAIQALLYETTISAHSGTSQISLGDEDLMKLKPSLKAETATGYLKTNWNTDIKPELAKVRIKNTGTSLNFAALHWQYQQKASEIRPAHSGLFLQRKYFIEKKTENGVVYEELKGIIKPSPGSTIKVILYLDNERNLEYVHLKDLRPSGTEPENVLSGFKYEDRLYYYQVTKDASTNFFISQLPKGSYRFEYNLRAVQSGIFNSGVATIQSIYAPEVSSHTNGGLFEIR